MVVTDLASGRVLFARAATSPATPASSAKVATAVAALAVLGPAARFTTRVVHGSSAWLGDPGRRRGPTLAAGRAPASDYPQPATLAALARQTARSLRAAASDRCGWATTSRCTPARPLAPGWTTSYITTGNVTPITSLEVDQGQLTASGKPEDADNPVNFRPRSFTPGGRRGRSLRARSCAPGASAWLGRVAATTAPNGRRHDRQRPLPLPARDRGLDAPREQQRDRREPGPAGRAAHR